LKLSHEEKERRKKERDKQKYNNIHRINNSDIEKICSICGEWLPCNEEFFYKNKSSGIDGFNPYCKECARRKSREYKSKHLEECLRKEYEYYHNNTEKRKLKIYEYTEKHKDHYIELSKQWRQNNKDKIKQYNYDRYNKNHKIYSKEWENCKQYFNYECAYCGISEIKAKEQQGQNLHKEHVNHEGANDLSNCVPSCRKCNTSKHTEDMKTWYKKQSFYDKDKLNKIHKWLDSDYKLYMQEHKPRKYVRKNNKAQ
jgi:hypothetical protein